MIKRITAYQRFGEDYYLKRNARRCGDDWFLCFDELNAYFELDDKPSEITVLLSDKPLKNGYFVQLNGHNIVVTRSNGEKTYHNATCAICHILNKAPKGIWAAIEA